VTPLIIVLRKDFFYFVAELLIQVVFYNMAYNIHNLEEDDFFR